jgi:hypothetical protein
MKKVLNEVRRLIIQGLQKGRHATKAAVSSKPPARWTNAGLML